MPSCSGFCAPFVIYVALAIIGTLSSLLVSNRVSDRLYQGKNKNKILFYHILGGIVWASVLYVMCSYCMYTGAWALLLFPVFLMILVLLLLVLLVDRKVVVKRRDVVIPGRAYVLGVNDPLGAPELRRI